MPSRSTYLLPALTGLLWLAAFILMLVASARCDFVQFTAETAEDGEVVSRGFGMWWYQYWYVAAISSGGESGLYVVESCASYPTDSVPKDAAWKAAQAFNVIVLVLAILTLVLMCVAACAADDEANNNAALARYGAPFFLTMTLCQGLNLLFLTSEACHDNPLLELGDLEFPVECGLATGAKCCIAATCLWFAAAVSSFFEAKAIREERAERDRELRDGELSAPLNA